jgi:hypothetical protein
MSAGMELSVAGRNNQSGADFYQVFGFATATARPAAFNPVPELPTEPKGAGIVCQSWRKKPGPVAGANFAPAAARAGNKKPGKPGAISPSLRGKDLGVGFFT